MPHIAEKVYAFSPDCHAFISLGDSCLEIWKGTDFNEVIPLKSISTDLKPMKIWKDDKNFVVRFTIGYLIWFDEHGNEIKRVDRGFGFIPELNSYLTFPESSSGNNYFTFVKDEKELTNFDIPNRIELYNGHIYLWSKHGISKYSISGDDVKLIWNINDLPFRLKRLMGFSGETGHIIDRNSRKFEVDLEKGVVMHQITMENKITGFLPRTSYFSDQRYVVILVEDIPGKREFAGSIGVSAPNSKIIDKHLDCSELSEDCHFIPQNKPVIVDDRLYIIDNLRNFRVFKI